MYIQDKIEQDMTGADQIGQDWTRMQKIGKLDPIRSDSTRLDKFKRHEIKSR